MVAKQPLANHLVEKGRCFGRYFMKLGSPSIITTLWEVDDKASKDILSTFYNYMDTGLPLNIALHNAKIDYIANLNSYQSTNPINWAGYVLIGNYDSIELNKKVLLWGIPIWYYILGLTFGVAILFFFSKFK